MTTPIETYVVPGVPDTSAFTITYAKTNSRENPHLITLKADWGDGDAGRWPREDKDMRKLPKTDSKNILWRRTAAEWIAKDIGEWEPADSGTHWELDELPLGYGLFQQVTHPKPDNPNPKLRLDRFVFGHSGRKIRSAISLGKHLIWVLHGQPGHCQCDGCKTTAKAPGRGSPAPARRGARRHGSDDDDSDSPVKRRGRPPNGRKAVKRQAKRGTHVMPAGIRAFSSDSESEEEDDRRPRQQRPAKQRSAPIAAEHDCFNALALREDDPLVDSLAQATARQQRTENLLHPALPRVSELVWARVAGLEHIGSQDVTITHWPAMVLYREAATGSGARKAAWEVELLATGAVQHLHRAVEGDILPWLGYVPNVVKGKCGGPTDGRPWQGLTIGDLWQKGADAVFACFEVAVQAGKIIASMQMRPLPTLHALPYRSRYLTHPFIHFGPEVIYPGDPLRLLPSVESQLPASVHSRRRAGLPTSLVLRVTRFERAATAASSTPEPLKVWGRVFEMYELRDPAQAALSYGTAKDRADEDEGPDLATSDSAWWSSGSSAFSDPGADRRRARSRASTRALPGAFPAHRWRCLTPEGDVGLAFGSVAGRYYPPASELDSGVNAIVERVRRTGLLGEGGIKPLGLGLAGLVSMNQVLQIQAVNGVKEDVDRVQVATQMAARLLFPPSAVPDEFKALVPAPTTPPDPSSAPPPDPTSTTPTAPPAVSAPTPLLPASLRAPTLAPAGSLARPFLPSRFPSARSLSGSLGGTTPAPMPEQAAGLAVAVSSVGHVVQPEQARDVVDEVLGMAEDAEMGEGLDGLDGEGMW